MLTEAEIKQLASQELAKRYSLTGRTQVAPRVQTMRNDPSVRSYLSNFLRDTIDATGLGGGYRQGLLNAAGDIETAVDFVPVAGDVLALEDAARSYGQGDLVGTGINMMGAIPIVGDVAAKGAKAARSSLSDFMQESFPSSYKPSVIESYTRAGVDPRTFTAGSGANIGDPRVGQIDQNLSTQIEIGNNRLTEPDQINLEDYEGYPFVTSMSDRTAAGDEIISINGVPVNRSRRGGQDYMFDPENPDLAWASDESVVLKPKGQGLSDVSLFKFAQNMKERGGGRDPLFIPWTMAPTGGDFSQVGEVMLAYAKNGMDPSSVRKLDKDISQLIPGWKGIQSPESMADFYSASGDARKAVINLMDKKYVDQGSLTSGQARLAMMDDKQMMSRDGNLMNVGQIDTSRYPLVGNPHPAYNTGLYGQGLGRLAGPVQVYELMPQAAALGGMVDVLNPARNNLRALEMKPYGGIITEDVLRGIENRRALAE